MRRRGMTAVLAALAVAGALGLNACQGGGGTHKAVSHAVSASNFAFVPDTITVSAGDTVIWRNDDPLPHTVRSDPAAAPPAFNSGDLAASQQWRWVAEGPGRHPYHCDYHPNMTGVVIVK